MKMGGRMTQAATLFPASAQGSSPRVEDPTGPRRPAGGRAAAEVRRVASLMAGLIIFGAGLTMMIRADLGLSPWDVLHDAIRSLTPLTFGQVVVALSLIVLGIAWALGIRPGPATVVNSVLVGLVVDAMLATGALGELGSGPVLVRIAVLLAGVSAIALGTAAYIAADLGAGPRDGLMLGIARRARRSTGGARVAIESTVLIVGLVLGGSIGLGTAIFVIAIGPAINAAFRLFGMEPRRTSKSSPVLRRFLGTISSVGRRKEVAESSPETMRGRTIQDQETIT